LLGHARSLNAKTAIVRDLFALAKTVHRSYLATCRRRSIASKGYPAL
jgi:hypothetical protein